ncbi:MAG: helix-turn-helix domain-containing protein [Oscillospiraceae bacterium]
MKKVLPLLRVSLNAEETVTVFPALFFLSEGRRKEVKTLNGYSYLTLEQRREIERMYAEGERVVDIAARLKKERRRYLRRVEARLYGRV